MPSWLTFDSGPRVLYCSDESGDANEGGEKGSLSAYSASSEGKLRQIAKTDTIAGGVNSVVYETEVGEKVIAIAH